MPTSHLYRPLPLCCYPFTFLLHTVTRGVYPHLKIWSSHRCLFSPRMAAASSSHFYMASISAMCPAPFIQSLLLGLFEAVCGAWFWPLPSSFEELHKALNSVEKIFHQCKARLEADSIMSQPVSRWVTRVPLQCSTVKATATSVRVKWLGFLHCGFTCGFI